MTENSNINLCNEASENQHSSQIKDILSMEKLSSPNPIAVSPDGKWLAVTVQNHCRRRHGGGENSRYLPTGFPIWLEGSEIWIVEVKSKKCQNLTPDWGTNWGTSWSPDGEKLAFYSDKNDIALLWIWERDTNQSKPACDEVIRPFLQRDVPPRWTPDGRRIVVKLEPETKKKEGAAENKTKTKAEATVREFRFIPEAKDETEGKFVPEWSDWFLADIGVVTVATGEVNRLARELHPFGLAVSPDGTVVVVMNFSGFETVKAHQALDDLYLLPLDGNPLRCLVENIPLQTGFEFSWSPDRRYLAYVTQGPKASGELFIVSTKDGSQRNLTRDKNIKLSSESLPPLWSSDSQYLFCVVEGDIWQVSVEDGSFRNLTEKLERKLFGVVHKPGDYKVWSPDDGQSIYVQTFNPKSKQDGYHRVDIESGESRKLVEENRIYHHKEFNPDIAKKTGDIFYIVEDITHPADVWKADSSFKNRHRVTKLNPEIEKKKKGEIRLVDWETPEGKKLQGMLLLPVDYKKGKRYPLITKIYGGSSPSNRLRYFVVDNMYLFTSHGYAVLLPDIPMETNNPIKELTDAVLPGVDKVVSLGIADKGRLGVMGHSYGGYCVNAIITQISRFAAAVSSAPISNLVSFYGFLTEEGDSPWIGWAEMRQGGMGGSLWEERERYIENSPIFYLDKVETPLLLIHGEKDLAAAAQAGEMFSGLRRLGKKVVLVRYLGEGHWWGAWRYPNAFDFWQRVLAWFDEHLNDC